MNSDINALCESKPSSHTSANSVGLALNTISGNYMESEGLFIVLGFVIWTLSRSLPGSVPVQGLTTNNGGGRETLIWEWH